MGRLWRSGRCTWADVRHAPQRGDLFTSTRCLMGGAWKPAYRVLHLRGLTGDGLVGYSVIRELMREAWGWRRQRRSLGAASSATARGRALW